jgi:hypothetical protein
MHDDNAQEETVESLAEAMRDLIDITMNHAQLITSLIRALDAAGIDIPGIRSPLPPTH